MKFNDWLDVYGDTAFRGKCPPESQEQITFFNWLRNTYPETYGIVAIHPRNEGQLRGGQHSLMSRKRAEGMTAGAADIVIPGAPAFVCELKRRDHTQSSWQEGQEAYLKSAQDVGCFTCVALGAEAARQAFLRYLEAKN